MEKLTIATTPYQDQLAGTSGLRKKTQTFLNNTYYLENYIQSCFNVLQKKTGFDFEAPIILGGDNRFYNDIAIQKTIKIAIANGFKHIIIAKKGLLSTPAASYLIRDLKASCGFIFSASHNPAGENGDIGIKLNLSDGGPAPIDVTNHIFEQSKSISTFYYNKINDIDLDQITTYTINDTNIQVIDSVNCYVDYLETLFNFPKIKNYLKDHQILFDAMHAVTGPYAKELFYNRLGAPIESIINAVPKKDFNNQHPDPNPTNNAYLYELALSSNCPYELLAASDGDGDRNMILGKGIYINPCDSLAIITDKADSIPYLKDNMTGVARSMPTSRAVDIVAREKNITCYETPTGWKYFGSLLNHNEIQLCGEESFGTSSIHVREKDGIWAILSWLNLLAYEKEGKNEVKSVAKNHWKKYGRHYYQRLDFENLNAEKAKNLIQNLNAKSTKSLFFKEQKVTKHGQFSYTESKSNMTTNNQGFQIIFSNIARFIVRLSGTGTSGATLRLYLEVYDKNYELQTNDALKELRTLAIHFLELKKHVDKEKPDYII